MKAILTLALLAPLLPGTLAWIMRNEKAEAGHVTSLLLLVGMACWFASVTMTLLVLIWRLP